MRGAAQTLQPFKEEKGVRGQLMSGRSLHLGKFKR